MSYPLSNDIVLKLLAESPITPGKYKPSSDFKASSSVGIALDGKPIMLLGWSDDSDSHDVADRLLDNHDFATLVRYEYGCSDNMAKVIIDNADIDSNQEYNCITESKQGVVEDGVGQGMLVAVTFKESPVLSFSCCINNSVMQCFYPESTPLSTQISLDA
ncbi:hypothetical protein [Psychrobacter sp. AOP31-A1-22]|uniref:hypothetical protein n=1 Tax=Psychrobacter sp. AOP31-A1-22 TaxID=3457696 RepID=UPI00403680EA